MSFGGGGASESKSLRAFTLAEVLITLGVLGIVIAMTLPALIGKYNKKVLETAFKKSVNTILNTHKQLFANEEQFSLCSLEDFECNNPLDFGGGISLRDGRMDIYMKKLGFEKTKMNAGGVGVFNMIPEDVYAAKDGSCYYPYGLFPDANASSGPTYEIFIDTNCSKGPNKGGRDQFFVVLDEKLSLITDISVSEENLQKYCKRYANVSNSDIDSGVSGFAALYCGSYLIMNSYKMDY